ncbi:hypothetical protein [Devosia naphthalenivorans]|uniref:hypothetical protein n=1 Tax=Devosia naphthalenivorans TaxID=2082392 RepID=UPI000D3A70D4|nr:hypothetical protein [Devosia naphthalenivorans]
MSENHEITRRALLIASPAVLALTVAPAAVRAMDVTPTLGALIEAHRQAYEAQEDACCAVFDVENQIKQLPSILAPITVYPDGSPAEMRDLSLYDQSDVRQSIINRHAELRRIHCCPWSERMAPGYVAQLRAELDASEKRAFELLEKALAGRAELERQAGLYEVEAVRDAAAAVEVQTRIDLLLYRPKDAAEAEAKEGYIGGFVPFMESWYGDDEFTIALINRLGEVA